MTVSRVHECDYTVTYDAKHPRILGILMSDTVPPATELNAQGKAYVKVDEENLQAVSVPSISR